MKLRFLCLPYCFLLLAAAPASADLIASVHLEANPSPNANQQSYSGQATRTTSGNVPTRGLVGGTFSAMSGHQTGTNDYNGIDISTFTDQTSYQNLTRFGSTVAGGLLAFDYDLSTYLSGVTPGVGNTFSFDIDFSDRRLAGTSTQAGLWFMSYNGGGLTLDTSDITTHTVSGTTSGSENFALVNNATLYKSLLTLPDGVPSGTATIDITSDISAIKAGDGLIRLAFLEREFRGDVRFHGASGINITAVPEPSCLGLLGIASCIGLVTRRRRSAV